MDSYRMIEGMFTYIIFLGAPGKVSGSKFLGWQSDERILWIVPCDTSFRTDHITGSGRSRSIEVDSIESIRNVGGIRKGLEIRWRDYGEEDSTTIQLLESRRQGRMPEVEFLLRTAWNGWCPSPEVQSDEVSEDAAYEVDVYTVDGTRLPAWTPLMKVAMYYLSSPDAHSDWTLTVRDIKRLVEEQSGMSFEDVEDFTIEINGHSLSRSRTEL